MCVYVCIYVHTCMCVYMSLLINCTKIFDLPSFPLYFPETLAFAVFKSEIIAIITKESYCFPAEST